MIEIHNNTIREAQLNNIRTECCEKVTIEKESIRKYRRKIGNRDEN